MAKELFAAKLTSIWIGGFFFWIINGFKGNISEQFTEEYENRNIWVGYIITILIISFLIYFIL